MDSGPSRWPTARAWSSGFGRSLPRAWTVFDAAGFGALPDLIELRGGTDRIVTIADMGAQEAQQKSEGGHVHGKLVLVP